MMISPLTYLFAGECGKKFRRNPGDVLAWYPGGFVWPIYKKRTGLGETGPLMSSRWREVPAEVVGKFSVSSESCC